MRGRWADGRGGGGGGEEREGSWRRGGKNEDVTNLKCRRRR